MINTTGDDVQLAEIHTSHLEQADDNVLLSYSPLGLQRKLDHLYRWCSVNFMEVNVGKTKGMIFGPLPHYHPEWTVGGWRLPLVDEFCYVGILFCSTEGNIFARFLTQNAKTARKLSNACRKNTSSIEMEKHRERIESKLRCIAMQSR